MHPGWANTVGVQNSLPTFQKIMQNRLRNAQEGADTIVWLAIAQRPRKEEGSHFWFDRKCPYTLFSMDKKHTAKEELWTMLSGIVQPYC